LIFKFFQCETLFLDLIFSELRWKHNKHGLAEYGQKYYKPPHEPPLLSWEDMTQIRHLYKQEGWPVDVLARSFPANEVIIKVSVACHVEL